MATLTALFGQIGPDTLSVEYDSVSLWVSAAVLDGPDTVFVSATDTVTGQTFSGTFAPGTYAIPANRLNMGNGGPIAQFGGRISYLYRVPA